MQQTIVGILMAILTCAVLYAIGHPRYRCPNCARQVKWGDVTCPHCGEDMNFRHRGAPPPTTRRRSRH